MLCVQASISFFVVVRGAHSALASFGNALAGPSAFRASRVLMGNPTTNKEATRSITWYRRLFEHPCTIFDSRNF
jgi:hypothetical protein